MRGHRYDTDITLKLLVDKGANVNCCRNSGKSVLQTAARYGTLEVVQYLVACGAGVLYTNNFYTRVGPINALHEARQRPGSEEKKKIVKFLDNEDQRARVARGFPKRRFWNR